MGDFFTGFGIAVFLMVLLVISTLNPVPYWSWKCTASERIGDTLPEQFMCIQYSKEKPKAYIPHIRRPRDRCGRGL